jgi:hypothetical protein
MRCGALDEDELNNDVLSGLFTSLVCLLRHLQHDDAHEMLISYSTHP